MLTAKVLTSFATARWGDTLERVTVALFPKEKKAEAQGRYMDGTLTDIRNAELSNGLCMCVAAWANFVAPWRNIVMCAVTLDYSTKTQTNVVRYIAPDGAEKKHVTTKKFKP